MRSERTLGRGATRAVTTRPEARLSPPSKHREHVVRAAGRSLAVDIAGAERGWPVFLMHGTPGSRNGPRPRSSVLYRLGVRLISYDRPGYGGSSRLPGRRIADAAADIAAIADDLGIDEFSVVGRSGGGPHALACAALLPERVRRTAVLVGLAPAGAAGLDWFGGMTEANVRDYGTAEHDVLVLAEQLRLRAERTIDDPGSLLSLLVEQMTEADRRVVAGVPIRRQLTDAYAEALRRGPDGWIDDVLALRADWGITLTEIRMPVRLWHGADDNFAPASHTRWLAEQIPDAQLHVQRRSAHFGAVEVLPEMLAWLTRPSERAPVRSDAGR
ncbi:alpha/beta fold hydrolase [Micromonospora citrea]|uniref:alpha/beta fold hydrolase n=1 Tax=Micromonospora citrea TaxID=47855 RepID=UPI003C6B3600